MKQVITDVGIIQNAQARLVRSMPSIPRGNGKLTDSLRTILDMVQADTPLDTTVKLEGSSSEATLNDCCVSLHATRIVQKTKSGYEVSPLMEQWLTSGDNALLARLFSDRCFFFSGMLVNLKSPMTARELLETANNEYGASWKQLSEIQSRLKWSRDLGLVELREYENNHYYLTELGIRFISSIDVEPTLGVAKEPEFVPPSEWALQIALKNNDSKNANIGFLVGGSTGFISAAIQILKFVDDGVPEATFYSFLAQQYELSKSSAKSAISMLIRLGFIVRSGADSIRTSALGEKWLSTPTAIDFACICHASCCCLFELLGLFDNKPVDSKTLSLLATERYGIKLSSEYILARVNILRAAGLVLKTSSLKFTVANCVSEIPEALISRVDNIPEPKDESVTLSALSTNELIAELWEAARDSQHPRRLEKAVSEAFGRLGYRCALLGGSGETDVLLYANAASKYAYKVAVDAKSTANGSVDSSQVDFDTLKLHRKKHNADHLIVVGYDFTEKRLLDRATEHDVLLVGIRHLEKLLKSQLLFPLSSQDLRILFSKPGVVDLDLLSPAIDTMKRHASLLAETLKTLLSQNEDPVFGGVMTARDVYWVVRNNGGLANLSLVEVKEMLGFLSSPLVGCIGKSGDGYYAIGSFQDAARRLSFLADAYQG